MSALFIIEIISHPQNKQTLIGSTVSLVCKSSISSDVMFLWTHNGRSLQEYKHQVVKSTGDTSTLIITKVKNRDAGDYVCEVRCGPLLVTSTAATLTINSP